MPTMLVTNLELVPGRRIVSHYGIVQGSTVRAKHVGKDIFASFKNIVGGELKSYTELMQEARQEAIERMIAEAQSMGANAVLNVRFATTSIAAGAAEILAYGSAVQLDQG
ncbi:MAG: YbjQ family protein [Burkholderiaceae bacterium]